MEQSESEQQKSPAPKTVNDLISSGQTPSTPNTPPLTLKNSEEEVVKPQPPQQFQQIDTILNNNSRARLRMSKGRLSITGNVTDDNVLLEIKDIEWPVALSKLYNDDKFFDLILRCADENNTKFYCHRGILAYSSKYFLSMFSRDWRESNQSEIEIGEDDPEMMALLLQFIYKGHIQFESIHIIPLLAIADRYEVSSLMLKCGELLSNVISVENVCSLFMAARRYSVVESSQTLEKACKDKILEEFAVASETISFLSELDFEALVDIIESDDLHAEEKDVFDSVIRWVEYARSDRLSLLDRLLEHVRFPCMPTTVLVHLENDTPLLQESKKLREFLFEALKYNIDSSTILESIRDEPRFRSRAKLIVKHLPYNGKIYESGIIKHLGGMKSTLNVYSSSINRGETRDFISTDKVFVWTKNEPLSWFAVDFGHGISVLPTHYSLRYGSSGNNVPPRNWLLQATNKPFDVLYSKKNPSEDYDWVTLSTHEDDKSIDTDHGCMTWALDLPEEKKTFYRMFRIIQIGKNKMPHNREWCDVLVASGFEVYGELKRREIPVKKKIIRYHNLPTPEENVTQKQFIHKEDRDLNGIIYALGDAVKVSSSSQWRGETKLFTSKDNVFCWTKNEPYSWFAVDLGEGNSACPTNYTLCYGSSGNNVPPRNWALQGTNDAQALTSQKNPADDTDWVTLWSHKNDTSINSSHGSFTWETPLPENKREFFRFFRIIQTGKNKMPQNKEWCDVLVASGFELYGYLRTKKDHFNF